MDEQLNKRNMPRAAEQLNPPFNAQKHTHTHTHTHDNKRRAAEERIPVTRNKLQRAGQLNNENEEQAAEHPHRTLGRALNAPQLQKQLNNKKAAQTPGNGYQ